MENKSKPRVNPIYIVQMDYSSYREERERLRAMKVHARMEDLVDKLSRKMKSDEEKESMQRKINDLDIHINNYNLAEPHLEESKYVYLACSNLTIAAKFSIGLIEQSDPEKLKSFSYYKLYRFFKTGERVYVENLYARHEEKKLLMAKLVIVKTKLITNKFELP